MKGLIQKETSYYHADNIDLKVNPIKFQNGHIYSYGSINHPGSSMAIAMNNKDQIILIRQYRYCIADYIYEFPSGTIENDEKPLDTMKRELKEETGFEASSWHNLGEIYDAPSYSNELIHLFLAKGLSAVKRPIAKDVDEDIEALFVSINNINNLIKDNVIVDSASIAIYFKALKIINI